MRQEIVKLALLWKICQKSRRPLANSFFCDYNSEAEHFSNVSYEYENFLQIKIDISIPFLLVRILTLFSKICQKFIRL